MKIYITLLLVLFTSPGVFPQNSSSKENLLRQIAEVEAEIERLQNRGSNEKTGKTYCYEKVEYHPEKPMTTAEFEKFCQRNLPTVIASNPDANYTVISSCRQTPMGAEAHFCVTTTGQIVNSNGQSLSKEKELKKIANTKAMYADLIESLYGELKTNGIEIVDETTNLGVKHIEIKGVTGSVLKSKLKELKDNAFKEVRSRFGISEKAIENENARLVDDMTNQAESLLSLIPGGSLVTCHYLWRILKSTPEIGKVIGDAGAMVNIYFQIDEFQKKLQQLEAQEQQLLNETK